MNKNLSPVAITVIVVLALAGIILACWFGSSPGRKADMIEKSIESSVIRPGGGQQSTPAGPTGTPNAHHSPADRGR